MSSSDIAISVRGLSKSYTIAHNEVNHSTLAETMLQMPAVAMRETKRLVHLDEGAQPKVAHRADTEAYLRCLELPDAQEGLKAFSEKRPPKFMGQ